ncbi:phage tail protein [Aliiroseovarius lamellibrachiae]|uniref:phage tail-collar fiber domain-containing protein n=1 Tax=Aliiroseovarius lamellibrachiae TaxID=1924933 RepID=UPI001BE0A06F|nr:phage tail protein [Aliiroseovarius lamellibrachiae]MBT2130125.1 phage tail protein [Aliiroseovarius lamellibrachiae]
MSSYALMTNVGRNKEAAALANGTSLSISQIAWGDGDRSPSGGETALLNETGRKDVQGTGQVAEALNTAFFEILLDANEGPFVIREAGLFDVDGDLIAIAKYDPPVNKPKDTVSALLRIHVVFSDLENLILQVQSTDAYVPVERKVTAGAGLAGGGDLSGDRTVVVDFATQAEALAGVAATKVISPATLKARIDALIGSATPEALDTLQEIAAAMNNDDDLAATLTALIATKMNAANGVGTGITALEKLITGGAIEVSTHAKAQINGFIRSGALLVYAHQGDDALNPLIAGSVKALMNRATDNRPTWGGSPVWTDDAGGRSLPGMSGATWWRSPDGLIIQAAWPSAADGQTVTFPITFPNACNAVMLTENHPTAVLSICAQNVTPSGFTFRAHNTVTNVTHSGASQHMMLAIGH